MWARNYESSDPDTVQRPHTHTHRTKDHGITGATLSDSKVWKLNVAEREMKLVDVRVSRLYHLAGSCLPPRFTSDGLRLAEDVNGKHRFCVIYIYYDFLFSFFYLVSPWLSFWCSLSFC